MIGWVNGFAVLARAPFAWRVANAPPHSWARPSGNQPVSPTSRDIDPEASTFCVNRHAQQPAIGSSCGVSSRGVICSFLQKDPLLESLYMGNCDVFRC